MRGRRALAWRPVHRTTAKQMDVEMVDGLTAVRAGVDDQAVAVGEVFGAGDFAGYLQEMAEDGFILWGRVGVAGDVIAGDDEDVRWRFGIDVVESEGSVVFVDLGGRDFSRSDFAEEAAHG